MSQLRRDPITGRIVIVAEIRGERPGAFVSPTNEVPQASCPFCPGSEHQTPAEVLALRDSATAPNSPGWQVRVVPNQYPAVLPASNIESPARGIHEVIVETPRHVTTTGELSTDELRTVFEVYRARLAAITKSSHIKHAIIFKNIGRPSGSSIEHLHSQLIATEFIPPAVDEELAACVATSASTTNARFAA